jgi:primary-amine oxidase
MKPDGFFAGNPTVDLPPSRDLASKEELEHKGMQPVDAGAPASCCLPTSKL